MKYTAKDNFIKIGRAFRGDDNFDEPRTREEWHNLIGSVIPDADFDEWFEEARPSTFSEWFAQHPTSEAVDPNEMSDEDLDLYVADYVQEKIAEALPLNSFEMVREVSTEMYEVWQTGGGADADEIEAWGHKLDKAIGAQNKPKTTHSFSEWYAKRTAGTDLTLEDQNTDEIEHLADLWLKERIGL